MDQKLLVRTLVEERIKVLGYIQFLVRSDDLSEDIFQDVCALAVEKFSSIQDKAHLLMWLRTTARLLSLNALRKRRDLSLDDGLIEMLETDWQQHDEHDNSTRVAALEHCMSLLSEKSRELIRKRYFLQVDYPQLAIELQRTLNSLYVTFSRIHAELARCVTARLTLLEGQHD